MCGIAGIVMKQPGWCNALEKAAVMSNLLKHRGPDGEGFITAQGAAATPRFGKTNQVFTNRNLAYIPKSSLNEADQQQTSLVFAHRRLSIIDLKDTGHQPMCSYNERLWITYNGEIYNYIELRNELQQLGYVFISESDTEVILNAYLQWGPSCVQRFNGMWAFCIYDTSTRRCFASRDRLGVKPFYFINQLHFFAFASEQKALVGAGLVKPGINKKALHSYLINGLLENEKDNFFEGITELWPGHNLFFDINNGELTTECYFHLRNQLTFTNNSLDEKTLIEKINTALENSVKLRLRSDVEVGTCLSGGIDSSVLALTMAAITQKPVHCFTAIFTNQPFNEERFANIVATKINGHYHKTEPQLNDFLKETNDLIYSQDVPIWSTSTYAQYKVMQLAHHNNIKVVLDGQGADELFGGYHHHFVSVWNNLLSRGKFLSAFLENRASAISIPAPLLFYLKQRLKQVYNVDYKNLSLIFKKDFVRSHPVSKSFAYFNNLNEQLLSDIYDTRLKTFLKCEDRCGMWHSVESRVPFSDDINLLELMFSFEGNKKIQKGISKYLLREAMKQRLPHEIYTRYDKIGFETPMQQWMVKMRTQMFSEIKNASFDFVNYANLEKTDAHNAAQNKIMFKLFVLARWKQIFLLTYLPVTLNSVRRLRALFSGVSLGTFGLVSP